MRRCIGGRFSGSAVHGRRIHAAAPLAPRDLESEKAAMDPDLIDRIYESAFVPELWPRVLGDLAAIADAHIGFMFVSRGAIHNWTSSNPLAFEWVTPMVDSGAIAGTERYSRMVELAHSSFMADYEAFTPEEMAKDPFREILRPRRMGWAVATAVRLPTGDDFVIDLERELARGPVERERIEVLDRLRPHVARGALMTTRLQLERARSATATLDLVGLAAAVLGEGGRVVAANPSIEAMTGSVQWRASDRMALKDKTADRLLSNAIAEAGAHVDGGVRSFPVRGADEEPSHVAHVIPIRLSARDIFTRSTAVLVLTPMTLPTAAPVELVRSLFDLTSAEARVARGLATGKTVDELAADNAVTVNTVRAQVRGVLEKTGWTRQVDIVAMLTAISAVTPR